MFVTTASYSAIMLAAIVVFFAASIESISGLPTLSPAASTSLARQDVPSDIVWPSYVAHLSQAEPDRAFGPQQTAFVYRIPGENQDLGTQMAFTMPEVDDDNDDSLQFSCNFDFFDMNALWGTTDWASQFTKDQEFTIFGYHEAAAAFSKEDTWNQHPVVNYSIMVAEILVNSSGVYVESGGMKCESEGHVAQFWLQAVGNQSCDLAWTESSQPLSGMVVQRYILS